jgi:hypothetical protein
MGPETTDEILVPMPALIGEVLPGESRTDGIHGLTEAVVRGASVPRSIEVDTAMLARDQ